VLTPCFPQIARAAINQLAQNEPHRGLAEQGRFSTSRRHVPIKVSFRRVSAGKHVLLPDLRPENAEMAAKVLLSANSNGMGLELKEDVQATVWDDADSDADLTIPDQAPHGHVDLKVLSAATRSWQAGPKAVRTINSARMFRFEPNSA
jgi:hypothetical protein